MANFRDITKVEEITTFSETDKLIVNSNGTAKQIDINLIAGGVPDGGTTGQVLTKTSDVDGEAEWKDIKIPSVIKTAIIKSSNYDNALAGLQEADAAEVTYECINMTFEEAYETMANGEPLSVIIMAANGGLANIPAIIVFTGTAMTGSPALMVGDNLNNPSLQLMWTADGFSDMNMPS